MSIGFILYIFLEFINICFFTEIGKATKYNWFKMFYEV